MKRPSFQFYPADWLGKAKLRRCSEAARGAWMDVLCVLHDSGEYGVCRWPLAELARAAGVPVKLLRELAAKDVLKGADRDVAAFIHRPRHAGTEGDPVVLISACEGPCWYCSRFVRDEWRQESRGANTRFTPDNQPSRSPTRRQGERQGDGASSSASSSTSTSEQDQKTANAIDLLGEVSPQIAKDFRKLRQAKKAPLTHTAIDGIKREAMKAGLTLEAALSMCCERGWSGFKAEWIAGGNSANVTPITAPIKRRHKELKASPEFRAACEAARAARASPRD